MSVTTEGEPARREQWVSGPELDRIWATPAPETLAEDLEWFPGELADPFARHAE